MAIVQALETKGLCTPIHCQLTALEARSLEEMYLGGSGEKGDETV
jgi:hypothetical protein